jgi:drug/metabolite transporter (DMT)-like permease
VTDPALAIPLVAAASLGWAAVDTLRKALVRDIPPVPLLFLLTTVAAVPFLAWAALDGAPWEALAHRAYLVPAVASVALNVGANLAFLQALRISPLSIVVPLLSLTPVFATLLAVPLLGERPGTAGLAGVALVVGGALWLNAPRSSAPPPDAPARGFFREPGIPLMAFTALAWSLTLPLDKLAAQEAGAPLHGAVLNAGVALGLLAFLLARRELASISAVRKVPGLFLLAVAASALALALQLIALRFVLVAWVETTKRCVGNFSAVLLGRLLFGEPITPRKILAVAVMAAGVALLFL